MTNVFGLSWNRRNIKDVHPTLRKEEDTFRSLLYMKQNGCVKRQVNDWVTGCDWISSAIPCGRCFPMFSNQKHVVCWTCHRWNDIRDVLLMTLESSRWRFSTSGIADELGIWYSSTFRSHLKNTIQGDMAWSSSLNRIWRSFGGRMRPACSWRYK